MGLLLTLFFCFLVSCNLVETREQEFESIKKGMTKSEVLGAAGSPHWSDRKDGQDRWLYYINPHDRNTEKIVYFENNKVIEKGYRKKMSPSAEETELLKAGSTHLGPHNPLPSEKELRELIKEEVKKKSKSKPKSRPKSKPKPENFETI